ncbi:Histone-lysine N-methyltransferase SETMAR [Eumeta japonica]|uniref:Histone-lysine N-methyltransferase SETMAR n=1 Tax=Eumeta variegata TaxID=151549 RepID=A0A4C1W105_EUMVA|nr:Histone-lysine N-methyltransferase SETMAR [Eumeta japonica]
MNKFTNSRRNLIFLEVLLQKRKNAILGVKKKYDVFGPNSLSVRVAQNWFKRFESGYFDVKDEPRSGRSVTDKVGVILVKVEQDQRISSYDLAEELSIDHQTGFTYFKKAGHTKKFDTWVPHELTEKM